MSIMTITNVFHHHIYLNRERPSAAASVAPPVLPPWRLLCLRGASCASVAPPVLPPVLAAEAAPNGQ